MLSPKKLSEAFSDHYVNRLDLGQDPFDRNYKSDFFYQGGERRKVLEQLVHYGRFSKQPVLLTGDVGSGKDRLLKEIVDQLQAVMDCCRVSVELLSSPQAIMSAIAERLGLKLDANNSLQSFIEALKFTLNDQEELEPLLIIIEKVQLLSADELEFLFDLQKAGRGGIHMLLVADEIAATLDVFCGDGQEALKTIQIRPLSQQETVEYVLALLQSVGYAGDMPLTKEQWQDLHEKARGNFYAINEWMPEMLKGGAAILSGDKSFGIPITHIIAISILVAAIIIAYMYQGDGVGTAKRPVQLAQQVKQKESLEEKPEPVSEIERPVNKKSSQKSADENELSESKIELQKQQTPTNEQIRNTVITTEPAKKKVLVAEKAEPKQVIQRPIEKVELTPQVRYEKVNKLALAPPAVKEGDYSKQEQRLLDIPKTAYMLQLLGTRKEESAEGFAKKHASKLPVTYFETQLKNKPWFVVLVGPYDNRNKALAAIRLLPKGLQRQKPWVRAISGIHAEILK